MPGSAGNSFTVTDATTGASRSPGSNSGTSSGWVAGGGIEWAFANNWTAKVEYDYVGLSNRSFTVPGGGPFAPVLVGDTFTLNHNIQMVTVGVNYLFNWGGPVVAPY